jgi:MoaA/NifB/PqqE/SkfB family radical SAM enzyme
MFNVNNQITFELTNRCNARCPLCPRTGKLEGGISLTVANPGFMDISLEMIEKLCQGPTSDFSYCGNFGDPIAHPKAMDIFKLVESNGIRQHINTNGSMQNTAWWTELGAIKKLKVTFALDGLEDTHSIYRINTDFNKILANAKAYMDNGGKATWMFIVFEHNQHQVEEAKAMATELGFNRFITKLSSREMQIKSSHAEKKGVDPHSIDLTTVTGAKGKYRKTKTSKVKKVVINAPTDPTYQSTVKKVGRKEVPISCYAINDNKMYIGPDEYVVPCCGTASDVHRQMYESNHRPYDESFYMFLTENNVKYDLNKYDMIEILNSYNESLDVLELYWDSRGIFACNERCGSNLVTEMLEDGDRTVMVGGSKEDQEKEFARRERVRVRKEIKK